MEQAAFYFTLMSNMAFISHSAVLKLKEGTTGWDGR